MNIEVLNQEQVLRMLPDRDPYGHKGTFGKVLLLCGSRGFTGAAYLAAMGALRTGAGLVFLGVPESIYEIEAVKLNEPVVFPLPDQDGMLSRKPRRKSENVFPRWMLCSSAAVWGSQMERWKLSERFFRMQYVLWFWMQME
jgi:NAD(P)H-hydrate repair Nnr-like enzyme with NAD(P)H-hydrate dehydratase domain